MFAVDIMHNHYLTIWDLLCTTPGSIILSVCKKDLPMCGDAQTTGAACMGMDGLLHLWTSIHNEGYYTVQSKQH